jgi:DNA mismatch repair protein MutS
VYDEYTHNFMNEYSTPMMKQYGEIKKQYKDCLLFYRMGDFYELFLEDAHIGARILNITLTSKQGGKDGKIPMAGVPYHAVDTYIAKLVKAGYKVAICEQLSPPNKKGIVKRDVVRIVTPGTLLDENNLNKKEHNYIVSIVIVNDIFSLSVADLSTGYFATTQKEIDNLAKILDNELAPLNPTECILPEEHYNNPELLKLLKAQKGMNIFPYSSFHTYSVQADRYLQNHFSVATLEAFGLQNQMLALSSAAPLLAYLKETQKGSVSHIKKLQPMHTENGLVLDRSTMINLELFSTIREHDVTGSLLALLDHTITAMGGRLLKQWIIKPLTDKEEIENRYNAIDLFLAKHSFRDTLRDNMKQIPDIERLLSRLSVNLGNARDLVNLKSSLAIILQIKRSLEGCDIPLINSLKTSIVTDLEKIITRIETTIVNEPPITVKDGKMIKDGVNAELDNLRNIINNSKSWIIDLERTEREKTGIGSLKVRFNKVFGFYIEISKANAHLAPTNYMRKQTLVNGERFITEELKKHEEIILSAEEKINEIEYKLFSETLEFVLSYTSMIQQAAEAIAIIDCITNFSHIAEKNNYTRPKLLYSGEIRIKNGRHPVVEKLLDDKPFVPNDVTLDNINQSLLLITGPNMAGKSVFIRQIALIVLMAQIGCYVPADTAHISIADRIFVRSGASDVITSGLSTFMVEMVETAHILNNATKNSLIIMDEIGRGTSTYDGISIAWAVAEYLVTKVTPSPKVLFATHYHELQALEDEYPGQIRNFHLAVASENEKPVFLHTILPGGASHSFGVAVAKLAGVPDEVINRAKGILQSLEGRNVDDKTKVSHQIELKKQIPASTRYERQEFYPEQLLIKELENIDLATMTPLEALIKLSDLKDKTKIIMQPTKQFVDAD